MSVGIYQIRNLTNARRYIGSAASGFRKRWNAHRSALRRGIHHSVKLQNAWNKYGEASFTFEILEYCETTQCTVREQHYLDTLLFASDGDSRFDLLGYNVCRAAGNCLGVKASDATKLKMSLSHDGESNARAKLTKRQVKRIKYILRNCGNTQKQIAEMYNVSRSAIRDIKLGRNWSDV